MDHVACPWLSREPHPARIGRPAAHFCCLYDSTSTHRSHSRLGRYAANFRREAADVAVAGQLSAVYRCAVAARTLVQGEVHTVLSKDRRLVQILDLAVVEASQGGCTVAGDKAEPVSAAARRSRQTAGR